MTTLPRPHRRVALTRLVPLCAALAGAEPWSFAILGDTQWQDTAWVPALGADGKPLKAANDSDSVRVVDADSLSGYRNPHMVPAWFLHGIHERLRGHGTRFLLAAGDLSDWPTVESMRTRATWAQELYDAGIGFFPVRGNHDEGPVAASEFLRVFPQTRNGLMGATPSNAILWTDSAFIHPVLSNPSHASFTMGQSFSSPACAPGRSYAFRDQEATFVLLDQFMGTRAEACPVSKQINWLDSVLSTRPAGSPAFVIAHKPLVGACHADNLFGDTPASDTASTARFFETLHRNGVEMLITGHDHQFQHSLIEEPGARALRLQQFILPGASYKFYPPLKIDEQHNVPAFGKRREIPLAQELGTVGYTLAKIDGPRVELQFWSAPSGIQIGDLQQAPDLAGKWTLRRRWGLSTRGKRTLLATGDSLRRLSDSALGTRARVLSGTWKASKNDFYNRAFSALASTDWERVPGLSSAAWTLWGLERGVGSETTPVFALALGLDPEASDSLARSGGICLARRDSSNWTCAGTGTPRIGAWKTSDAAGTRGYDPATRETWAVLDRAGTYAAWTPGGTRVARRPAPDRITASGRILSLPPEWRGHSVAVEILAPDGRLLERGTTRDARWTIRVPSTGLVLARCRAEDGSRVEAKLILPH